MYKNAYLVALALSLALGLSLAVTLWLLCVSLGLWRLTVSGNLSGLSISLALALSLCFSSWSGFLISLDLDDTVHDVLVLLGWLVEGGDWAVDWKWWSDDLCEVLGVA